MMGSLPLHNLSLPVQSNLVQPTLIQKGPEPSPPQSKKFRTPLKSALYSKLFVPKPIPEELGNLKTYSNMIIIIK